MVKSVSTIAATSTLAMVRAAEARGVRTDDLLRTAGIVRAWLETPDARLEAPTVLRLWDALRERSGDPALQLAAPALLPFGAYRVIDYLVAASATVGEGVEQFVRFFGLIADAVALTIMPRGPAVHVTLAMSDGAPVPPVYVDYILAALVCRIRMRCKPDLRVAALTLRRRRPASVAAYRDTFRAPVMFGSTEDGLSFTGDEWRAPMAMRDGALAQLLEEHARILSARVPSASTGIVAVVERAITARPGSSGSVAHVAHALNLSVRTLQRRLVEAGTTFREVSDDVRDRLAQGYLADERVSIAEVACLLGFSDQSSFNRAFRRWTGTTPRRWRRGCE